MYGYLCKRCGCRLDPGEGNICEECLDEMEVKKQREKEFDRMVRSTDYRQMNMEEFLK